MSRKKRDVVKLLLSLAGLAMPPACDGAGDDVLEDDPGTDTDADTEIDTEIDTDDCGVLDGNCCSDGWCRDTDAACTVVDTEGTSLCLTTCEPDVCTEQVEGIAHAACFDVSNRNDLGVCFDADDLGAGLEEGNACEASSSNASGRFNGFCCPRTMGGDGSGFGTGEGETGLASICGGIDMSMMGLPSSIGDVVQSGVGICLVVPWGDTDTYEWCGVPCSFDNSCDSFHHCVPTEASGTAVGYCSRESRRDRVLDPLDRSPASAASR